MTLRTRGIARGLRFLATKNDLIASLQPEMAAFKVFPPIISYVEKVGTYYIYSAESLFIQ